MALLRRSNWLPRRLMATNVLAAERAVARNKIVTIAALNDLLGARTPRIYSVFRDRSEMLPEWLSSLPDEFVLKSAVSSVGRHVCVLRRDGGRYVEPSGLVWTLPDLKLRAQRMPPPVYAEEIAVAHPQLTGLATHGTLCDLRLHFVGDKFVVGRCRIPTARSRGYGNVGRGAIGVCFYEDGRLDSGHPFARLRPPAEIDGKKIDGLVLVHWPEVFAAAKRVSQLFSSPHVGVDGTIEPSGRFIIIEVTLVPDTKWMSAHAALAFRDALRAAAPKQGRIGDWVRTRQDMWQWIARAVPDDAWQPMQATDGSVLGVSAG